ISRLGLASLPIFATSLLGVFAIASVAAAADRATSLEASSSASASESQASRDLDDWFESKVRPILATRCHECHAGERSKGAVRLDSRAAVLGEGSLETVVVPGDPDSSRLVRAIRHEGDIKMPPKAKLSEEEIAVLEEWVRRGAQWPTGASDPLESVSESWRAHWAFQPIRDPEPPAVDAPPERVRTPIDQFVLRALESRGLEPAPEADRRTLIRRATFDLTGLPPTPSEIEEFLADDRPDAWERVVERLLASPRYGERWARHWLDVSRYADTRGYVFTAERKYPFSYTYRDYVVRAFNEDLPFDRFIVEQLAADKLDLGDDREAYAAMGFLTLGRRFLNNIHDIIDDRIDVVTRGLMGFTVQCARCHDHKYDPIPTSDYYALYNVFQNSIEPDDLPLIAEPEKTEAYAKFQEELARREKAHEDFVATKHEELLAELRGQVGRYLLATIGDSDDREAGVSVGEDDVKPRALRRWRRYLEGTAGPDHPIFGAWHAFRQIPAERFGEEAAQRIASWRESAERGEAKIHEAILDALRVSPPRSIEDVGEIYTRLFAEVDEEWRCARAEKSPPPERLADSRREELRLVLYGGDSPVALDREEALRAFDRATRDRARVLQREIDSFRANSAEAPARAMVLVDRPQIVGGRVFERGNPARPGEEVERRFLTALSKEEPRKFTQGSGRLELAQEIVSPENPLTARVLANRIWLWHFGEGLVSTPSDFGIRSDPPSHPELLDYLASRLLKNGWSVKALHRLILNSATYRQSGVHPREAEHAAADPENRLLWRAPARRLEFEPLRDSLLAVSGRLDLRVGGPAVEIFTNPSPPRRTIYGFIERQNLPGVLRVFDFASPDATSPKRHETTVPQQALWLLNSPFAIEQARAFVARPDFAALEGEEARIRFAYAVLYGREPDEVELELGLEYVADRTTATSSDIRLDRWERYIQALLCANEFVFID
ncbi:MAG TPA: PSD1 and planctomycete cytochrome C domain-containing protein, partial [Planctomycetota bacterium]|nr:PSD1 and planctomycete cytochrome C domain-containing protein [Planctomycetota bacterium]